LVIPPLPPLEKGGRGDLRYFQMKKQKTAFILIVTTLIISGLLFSFYVKSKISTLRSLRASVSSMQVSYSDNKLANEKYSEEFKNLKQLFPEVSNITEFIENAYQISKRYSVRNITFDLKGSEFIDLTSGKILKALPISGQKPKVIYLYPVTINFNSGYRDMAEFIREIQNQQRLITIKSIKVKPEKEKDYLAVEMVVNIYSTERI
jgi:Tfp pilus assembly protein PilO